MGTHHEQFRAFARYNLEFNARLYAVVGGLPDAERRRDLGAFFGSIHATLNHILLADRIWLGRFARAFPEMTALRDADLVQRFDSLSEELYADFEILGKQRAATDRVITAWAEALSEPILAGTLSYVTSTGQARSVPTWVAVAHLFNHQTHHRGQISTLLHQLGHDVGVTDFVAYVA